MNAIIFDCEIVNAIQGKGETRRPGITYAKGWDDHAGQGISVIGVYDYAEDAYRVFMADNFGDFLKLCDRAETVISFNGFGFDNKLVRAALGYDLDPKSFDLLREVWVAAGLAPTFSYPSHVGYGLQAVSGANGGPPKSGTGELAPVLWQQGKVGAVVSYCLDDVRITKRLIDQVRRGVPIACPKTGQLLNVRKPF